MYNEKIKAFISFDYDHDLELKNALVAQSKLDDLPFEINDVSTKQAIDSNWKKYARNKIKESDVVIFICGKQTDKAVGVTAEMSITLEEQANYFLLCGRNDENVQKPSNAKKEDKIYKWTWDNLKNLLMVQDNYIHFFNAIYLIVFIEREIGNESKCQ